jgi:hypothetical protein
LTGTRRLDNAKAAALADVINRIDLKPPVGAHGCPMDNGLTNIVVFSYRSSPDVDLWWHASGCQGLDNSYDGAGETANPTFYDGFMGAMQRLRG